MEVAKLSAPPNLEVRYVSCNESANKRCLSSEQEETEFSLTYELFMTQQVHLKSVRVHFAYGRIALMLELLGRFGRFFDEDDRCNPPVLLVPFPRLFGL